MKLRVSMRDTTGATTRERDVTLTVDVTTRVGDVASAVVRGGAGDPSLLPHALHRHAPLTLQAHYPDGTSLVLDAGDAVASSGLRPGCWVEPVLESAPRTDLSRARLPVAVLTVLDGPQKDVTFLAVGPETTIGRDRTNRVELHGPEISRRHAVLRAVAGRLELEDLGSANGTTVLDEHGQPVTPADRVIVIAAPTVVEIGTTRVRVEPRLPHREGRPVRTTVEHLQAPFVDAVFAPPPLALPSPPEAAEPARFPVVAMLAPLMMGTVLYLVTQSALSLVFIALSPIIMVGTWLDGLLSRRRRDRDRKRDFDAALQQARDELEQNRHHERSARDAESPPARMLAELPHAPTPRLWARRSEHRACLEFRLGRAELPSRKEIELPTRASIPSSAWESLERLQEQYRTAPDLPVLERLDRCGSLGVAGQGPWADGLARALLVQLLSQHSPADVVFTAFADPAHAHGDWAWLKWLPHVDSAYSPLGAPHLVADPRSASVLLTALESLVRVRSARAGSATVRSRLPGAAEDGAERQKPAERGTPTPAVVVFVLSDTVADRTRLVGLAEDGPDVGVHAIWLAPELSAVPAACRTTVDVRSNAWHVHRVRQGTTVSLTELESLELPVADRFARALAPIHDAGARALDESDLPRSVPLPQLLAGDILDAPGAIVRTWEHTDTIVRRWQAGTERDAGRLVAAVGQGGAGPVEIDLRLHGPHALVGGTTGSGKSEFLQSWIFSLAAHHSPDRLTFLLVDYKGGAAFADCVDLPHTVGLVTDLNTHLVRRALTSLRAELRYREELLADKGAKDLISLERRADPDAPPVLIIVIDEFAALVQEIPEFVDGVIDVAQRGRSLGLHLVMATQRPAGVIGDNLRANTNLRIALRMADAQDSSDVLGASDAAAFSPETPGRAAMRVGGGALTHFQCGYLGGRSDTDLREVVEIRDLGFGEQAPWPLQPEVRPATPRTRKGPTDIERLARNIRAAALNAGIAPPRRPWVDQLPDVLPLGDPSLAGARAAHAPGMPAVGLVDEPHRQRTSPYRLPLAEAGNVVVYGGTGSGKTTALLTAAVAAIDADPHTIVYGIDHAGGGLATLAALPNTGEIVPGDDRERVGRLLRLLRTLIADRATASVARPPVLVVLDGFAAFRDAHEHNGAGVDPYADLVDIARTGRGAGVHVILTSERPVSLPTALAASVSERLCLRLPSEQDYTSLGVPLGILDDAPAGRAVRLGATEEIQLATPGDGADTEHTDEAIRRLAEAQQQREILRPPGVPTLPAVVARAQIAADGGGAAVFAVDTAHLTAVHAPETGLLLVTGPAGSGRTTTIRSLLEAFDEQSRTENRPLDAVLLSPRASGLRELTLWSRVADSADARDDLIQSLTRALGGPGSRTPGLPVLPLVGTTPAATPASGVESHAAPFPSPGHRGVVVIEDIGGFDGTGHEQPLAALLKLLRRSDLTTVVEGENATLGSVWELSSPLRGARWAIALRPDANDTPALFTAPFTHARRANFPPGRGYLLRDGALSGIHVGMPALTL